MLILILTRRPGDTLFIEPHPGVAGSDPAICFARPLEVRILRVEGNRVRIGIEAAKGLRIWREEREGKE